MSYLNAGTATVTQVLDGNQSLEIWSNGSTLATITYNAPENDGSVITRNFGPDSFRYSTADDAIGGATVVLSCQQGSVGYTSDGAVPTINDFGDLTGTPGSGTTNAKRGRAVIPAGQSSITITNSLAGQNSLAIVTLETADGTLTRLIVAVTIGSFTVTGNASATGNTQFSFLVSG